MVESWTEIITLLLANLPHLPGLIWMAFWVGVFLILVNWMVKPLAEQYAIHKYKKVSLKEVPEDSGGLTLSRREQ